jgi:uncharacterized membrane protein YhaH (DUF805 family)
MDVVKLLFSFQGRIGRGQFWLAILIFFIAALIVTVVDYVWQSFYISLAVAVIAYGPALICLVAAGIKRLHDRNKRSWWLLVFYLVPLVTLIATNLIEDGMIQTVLSSVGVLSLIWAFIELSCLRGTIAGNPYGPDPVAPKPAQH